MVEIGILLAGWLLGFVFFFRPKFANKLLDQKSQSTISVIIPARNEAHNLKKLLSSIVSQSCRPLEILVMNDHSTDQTATVGKENGATVVDVPQLPEGWNGKPFACFSGAKQAKGDYFLFLDADVWVEDGGIEKLMVLTHQENSVWSICPFHKIQRSYEEFSSIFNLMMICGTGAFAAGFSGKSRLTGQAMLISKQDYWKSGGHEVVRNRVLENFFLTDYLHQLGLKTHTLGGRGVLSMRMFPVGFGELVQSWKKGFVTGATRTPPLLMALIVMWMSAGISASIFLGRDFVRMDQSLPLASVCLFGLFVVQIRWMLTKIGTFGWINAIAFPVFFLFFIGLFFYSTLTKILGKKRTGKVAMWAEISPVWIAILNTIYFPVVMVGVGWITTRLPNSWFEPSRWIFKTWKFEVGLYEKLFLVRLWKHKLPDGSKMYAGGFSKKKLTSKNPEYLHQFSSETCRGEFAHWVDLALLPLVLLWNPGWAIAVMVSLGLIGNLPCIISQRYNRARIFRLKA